VDESKLQIQAIGNSSSTGKPILVTDLAQDM
jgi:hypothetical protein